MGFQYGWTKVGLCDCSVDIWVQFGSSWGWNGGRFVGLSHEFCVGQIIEIRTNNGDGYGMTLCFIVEYLIKTIMVITDGLSLVVSSFTDI